MKITFKITGMHCNSCAQKIENELKDKVKSISVIYSTGNAEIDFDENKISEKEIKEIINTLGYEATIEDKKEEKRNWGDTIGWIVVLVAILAFVYLIWHFLGLKIPEIALPQIGEKTSLILLFFIGILTGFHCVSMCGAFVVSYTAKNAINGHKSYKQHLIYGGSKVVSYTVIGGIFGLIGGIFAFSILLRGSIAIFAGIFMIIYSLSMMGIRYLRKFQINPKFIGKIVSKSPKGPYSGPLVTGLLNGLFIACGPLQAMYLYAAGTGSIISGATSLAVFGLGTLPVMLCFGFFATGISHKTTTKILKVSAIIVLILGLVMLNRGLSLVGSPISYDAIKTKLTGQSAINGSTSAVVTSGVQEINMNVDSSGYSPNSFVLQKGIPVKWNVNVKELTSCNSELVMTAYGVDVNLHQGMNVINFTPTTDGTIQFSCGMGMLHGSFIVTDTGTATTTQLAAAKPTSSGGGCGCGMKS